MSGPKTRRVHIGDLVTAYTGFNVTIDGSMSGVVRMAEFMINRELARAMASDGELIPFQLGRAVNTVKPTLAECFPWLDSIVPPNLADLDQAQRRTTIMVWMEKIIADHGAVHQVPRLPEGVWVDKDPMVELKEMVKPDATVIAAMPLNGTWETFTNPAPGMFHNPRLDDVAPDED